MRQATWWLSDIKYEELGKGMLVKVGRWFMARTFKSAGQEKEQNDPSLAPLSHVAAIGDGMYHPCAHPAE